LEKIAQLFVLLPQFLQKLPKVNSHPKSENSLNLVTLFRKALGRKNFGVLGGHLVFYCHFSVFQGYLVLYGHSGVFQS
jgi:hypothetical protein